VLLLSLTGCSTLISDEAAELERSTANQRTHILVTIPQEPPARALGLVGAPGQTYDRRRAYGPSPDTDRRLDRLARDYDLRRIRGWPVNSIGAYCEVFELPAGSDAETILEQLTQDSRVEVAQRMQTFETLGSRYNDTFADLQTAVTTLAVEPAHSLATGRGVRVAVIDSQIDTRHPELRGSVRHALDLVDSSPSSPPEVHGTAVAGVIASAANNTEGIVGIAPDVEIAALRACWSREPHASAAICTSYSLAQAIDVAIALDAAIINLSVTGPPDPLLGQLLDAAMTRGTIIVAATATGPGGALGFPASHPGVIAARQTSDTSIVTSSLTVAAPGREILTTTPEAGYAFFTGNSLAAAHVTGVIALLLERDPAVDAGGLVALLNDTANRGGKPGPINACRALSRLVSGGSCGSPALVRAIVREAR
jgi:subtilisin family serine protease